MAHRVRTVWILLSDVKVIFDDLSGDQKNSFHDLVQSCRGVLEDVDTIIEKNSEVLVDPLGAGGKTNNKDIGRRLKRTWKRIKWDPKEIDALRNRLTSTVSVLNAWISTVSK